MSFIIAIAGGSGSGKTTIARKLAARLDAVLIAEDDYYFCASTIPDFDPAANDFDRPSAKEHALLIAHLGAARRGAAFDKPLYDLKTHRRRSETERVEPRAFLLLDGIHAFATGALRAASDFKIYVDTDEDVRLARRIARDIAERGREIEEIRAQFALNVIPKHAATVAPQRDCADLVLRDDGGADMAGADTHAARIADIVTALRGKG